ncbi:MAG TPA: prolyl oligopeptidase family serine peptidase [Steroidobacteraceae bacterium]|nr:prolyl oligopeptidase family serine peptidase [Steroidobacteraceae bacterium]
MLRKIGVLGVAVAALGLAACGGTDSPTGKVATSNQRGTLVDNPALRIASVNASDFAAQLGATASGPQLLQLAGTPACGVDFYYFKYWTVGPDNSAQEASGALMVPTGSAAPCTGPRPIVLYAHGTTTDSAYNIADISDTSNSANFESALVAAVFAAQGYIVVAPNYLGYDISTLGYHPYLDGAENATVMMDALTAARTALLSTFTPATSDSSKLYVTGYSEGGYVAMATVKAMQAAGEPVTASAPSSGPYALEAFGDAIFFGQVNLGATVFTPLTSTSYQNAYGNVYTQTSDLYSSTYASGIDTLLPTATPLATLFQSGKLPQTAMFNSSTPTSSTGVTALDAAADQLLALPASPPYSPSQVALFGLGFGNPYLVSNTYRVAYVDDAVANPDEAEMTLLGGGTLSSSNIALAATPMVGLRKDLALNDMRSGGWFPQEPMLMCGGDQDPTVFFQNAQIMAALWTPYVSGGLVSVLDLNGAPQQGSPFAPLQVGLQQQEAQLAAAQGANAVASFHTTEAPFCLAAARGFFAQVP